MKPILPQSTKPILPFLAIYLLAMFTCWTFDISLLIGSFCIFFGYIVGWLLDSYLNSDKPNPEIGTELKPPEEDMPTRQEGDVPKLQVKDELNSLGFMVNETILSIVKVNIDTKEDQSCLFIQHREELERCIIDSMKEIVQEYFRQKGMIDDYLPQIRINDSRIGSLELELLIYIGKSCIDILRYFDTILKSPQIINELKNLGPKIHSKLEKLLPSILGKDNCELYITVIMDIRSMESIAGINMESHSILFKVDVSKDFLTFANHGEKEITDIRLGAFRSRNKKSDLTYANSYQALIRSLKPQKPISLEIRNFKNPDGNSLNLFNGAPFYFCCWLGDIHGVYIFKFHFGNFYPNMNDSILDSRRIYLKTRISRNFLHIKNLSGKDIKKLRLGMFKRDNQAGCWDYRESYQNQTELLPRNTEIALDINDFKDSNGNSLDLSGSSPLRVDCWVEDIDGTYIFQFAI